MDHDATKNIQKLPKWAQTEFRLLKERIEALEKNLAAHSTPANYGDKGTLYRMTCDLNGYRKIPDNAVRFVGEHVEFDVTHLDNGGLRVYAVFRHLQKGLCVVPETSNVFQIHVAPEVKERETVDGA